MAHAKMLLDQVSATSNPRADVLRRIRDRCGSAVEAAVEKTVELAEHLSKGASQAARQLEREIDERVLPKCAREDCPCWGNPTPAKPAEKTKSPEKAKIKRMRMAKEGRFGSDKRANYVVVDHGGRRVSSISWDDFGRRLVTGCFDGEPLFLVIALYTYGPI